MHRFCKIIKTYVVIYGISTQCANNFWNLQIISNLLIITIIYFTLKRYRTSLRCENLYMYGILIIESEIKEEQECNKIRIPVYLLYTLSVQ